MAVTSYALPNAFGQLRCRGGSASWSTLPGGEPRHPPGDSGRNRASAGVRNPDGGCPEPGRRVSGTRTAGVRNLDGHAGRPQRKCPAASAAVPLSVHVGPPGWPCVLDTNHPHAHFELAVVSDGALPVTASSYRQGIADMTAVSAQDDRVSAVVAGVRSSAGHPSERPTVADTSTAADTSLAPCAGHQPSGRWSCSWSVRVDLPGQASHAAQVARRLVEVAADAHLDAPAVVVRAVAALEGYAVAVHERVQAERAELQRRGVDTATFQQDLERGTRSPPPDQADQ